MMNLSKKHQFAFYSPELKNALEKGSCQEILSLDDSALWRRIVDVLRLRRGDQFDLFDGKDRVTIKLNEQTFATKKVIVGSILHHEHSKKLTPIINVYQGILRKEAFEAVAYSAAQLGITALKPVLCDKTQRTWHGEKERERLQSIMIAACEQSKQFVIPHIRQPISVDDAVHKATLHPETSYACGFETNGKKLSGLLDIIAARPTHTVDIFIGPEGGFSEREIGLFESNNIERYRLTPTILRSQEAFLVGVAVIRSVGG